MTGGRMNAVFFDVDGTLIDSSADLASTVNHTRRDLGLEEWPQADILKNVGLGARRLLADSIPEKADDVDALWNIFRSHYAEHLLEKVVLYPGVGETLEALRSAGWLLGINTAKPNFAVEKVLRHFGLDTFFGGAVIAGGDCDELKPSPKPLRECAAKMGRELSPGDWMAGDSWTDVECAKNAGVKGAFCAFGFGRLREGSAYDARLETMTDLLKYTIESAT